MTEIIILSFLCLIVVLLLGIEFYQRRHLSLKPQTTFKSMFFTQEKENIYYKDPVTGEQRRLDPRDDNDRELIKMHMQMKKEFHQEMNSMRNQIDNMFK